MAIKTEQRIYMGVAILAVLGGGLWVTNQRQKKEEQKYTSAASSANLPDIKLPADEADKITKVEIKNADKSDVILEKTGDTWRVTKPTDTLANQQNVKSMIDNLKELKAKELIDPSSTSYAEYNLDDPKAVQVVAYKGADKALDLYFGKSGGRGQMTRKAGTDGVYAISGYSAFLYTREVKNWRDTDIAKFDDAAVTHVDIRNENGDFAFKKEGDSWSGTFKGAKIEHFDDSKIKDMLRAYKALSAEDFADGKSDAETGFDKPTSTLVFALKEGEPIKFLVGKTSSGESRYLKKEGAPQTYIISSWAAGWAVAKVDKFEKSEEKPDGGVIDGGSASDAGKTVTGKPDTSKNNEKKKDEKAK